jgi:hypothetical protein
MLLLCQTLTTLKKQQVLDQAVTAGDNYHYIKVALQSCLRLGPHRRGREREKKDKDTGYLEGNLNSRFKQEIRQCLGMILSRILKITRMNGIITFSSTAFLSI